MNQTHIYICGAKGISQYGGFESFVQNLLEHSKKYKDVKYYVACKANGEGAMDVHLLKGVSDILDGRCMYNDAECFLVNVPSYLGSAQAIFYDIASIKRVCKHIEDNQIKNPVVYILACRIGPFIKRYVKRIHKSGGKIYLNPDGHEWARRKWSKWIRAYWKLSERMMVKYSDYVVCDSQQIEKYIQEEYREYNPKTTYIPYGASIRSSKLADNDYRFHDWLELIGTTKGQYYLVVGRFVEENNFDIIIKEFMKTNIEKKLILLTTFNEKLKNSLKKELNYKQDSRIVLTPPVYDVELLKKIREQAYAYIHGHEVGGTNPSLLEGLASTNLNLVFDVNFNREVAGDAALYWKKDEGSLADLLNKADELTDDERLKLGTIAKDLVQKKYDWNDVAQTYYNLMRKDGEK